jgi:hypothetical protein
VAREERAEAYIKADCTVEKEKERRVKGQGPLIVSVYHLSVRAVYRKNFR